MTQPRFQQTVTDEVTFEGVGIHTGESATLTVRPATPGTGIVFVRTDSPARGPVPARLEHVSNELGTADFGPEAFAPVAQVSSQNLTIAVASDSPYETLDDLISAARNEPDTLRFGVNIGGVNHFAPLILADAADVAFRYVQTGGSGNTIAALLGGHVEAGALSTGSILSYLESGDLRALAVLSDARDGFLGDVPTAAEEGYPAEFAANTWFLMPAGSPAEHVDAVAAAMEEVIAEPAIQDAYQQRGIQPNFVSGTALQDLIADTQQQIATTVEEHGLRR